MSAEDFSFLPPEHKAAAPIVNFPKTEESRLAGKRWEINLGFIALAAIFLFFVFNFFSVGRINEQKGKDSFEVVQSVPNSSAQIAPASLPTVSETERLVDINLSEQKMIIFENNQQLKEYVISTGKRSTPTRTGNFTVISKYPKAYGVIQGILWTMPFFLGIYKVGDTENGIHELPFANGLRERAIDMGYPVSHGCVRLGIGAAEEVYNWAPLGTPVRIHY